MRALLAITDAALRALWEGVLADHGHAHDVAAPTLGEWERVRDRGYELVVLELAPGNDDALDVCRAIRQEALRPSVLVLAHPEQAAQMVAALKAGADDVLVGLPDRRAAITHLASLERRRHAAPAPSPTVHELTAGYQFAELSGVPAAVGAGGGADATLPAQERGAEAPEPDSVTSSLPDEVWGLQASVARLVERLEATAQRHEVRSDHLEREMAEALRGARQLGGALERLRRAAAGERRPVSIPSPPPAAPAPTVLLIDDEATVRQPLRLALERCGFGVLEAADGFQALDIFARQRDRITVAVVDQRMPRMSGQEVLEELKRRAASLPVILISGQAGGEPAPKPGAVRADAFLRKPFELVDLARTVRRLTEAPAA
jgi:DNA-binding response OmpR family regulator